MAKSLITTLLLALALLGQAQPNSTRQRLQLTYCSQLGVKELTGHNDGVQVQAYLASIGLKGNYAWCSAYITWCMRRAGIPCPRFGKARSWFDKRHIVWAGAQVAGRPGPQQGDLVGYRWGAPHVSHVEFLDIWGESPSCQTVGGNTRGHGAKSREGDGVYCNWRLKSQVTYVANVIDDPVYTHGE